MNNPTGTHDPILAAACTAAFSELYFAAASSRPEVGLTVLKNLPATPHEWSALMANTAQNQLAQTLSKAWSHGWLPADVVRVVVKRWGRDVLPLLSTVVTQQLGSYTDTPISDIFWAQLAELASDYPPLEDVHTWFATHREGVAQASLAAAALWHGLAALGPIEQLVTPPGQRTASAHQPATGNHKVVAKVRSMLAKAESTEYEAEANAFVTAAQQLMTRHSIDEALLAAENGHDEQPMGIRIGIDSPYEKPKALLLAVVAEANRCQAVWSQEYGFSSVIGFSVDVHLVRTLFTSLVAQAATALRREGAEHAADGQATTRDFRHSFFVAFADRIGVRLQAASTAATDAAAVAQGDDVLPVLAAQSDRVTQAVQEMFPTLQQTQQVQACDAQGWASGQAAADQASLATTINLTMTEAKALPSA